jgi:hypothetical protein
MAMRGILWECGLHMIRNASKSNGISPVIEAYYTGGDWQMGIGSCVPVAFQVARIDI